MVERILKLIDAVPKFGNDIPEVDAFARDVAYTYTKPLEKYKNPRGGMFQAGLYPVSANVPLGGQTGATPDGRLAHMPVADGVSPSAGKDVGTDRQQLQLLFPDWITSSYPTEHCLTRSSIRLHLQAERVWKNLLH